MKSLRYRQVHLDFHTSECVPTLGDKFDKAQFQTALKLGHVNSITLFSKCHHGWAYHPSEANETHPKLKFDLLGAQLEACKEIDVNAPVYISAGYDEKYARVHTDHLRKHAPDAGIDFLNKAYYKLLCYNTPYLDVLCAQIEEVMQKYNPCGIFLDISAPRVCYCQYCINSMREKGLDPHKPEDAHKFADEVYIEYCRRTEEAVRKYNSETTIFHNAGNITRGRRDHAYFNTHLELESLPTGGWGYDHFPLSAAYARTLDRDFLGMTGKFHNTWGEFGGYKHPNALRYETALSLAMGAKCSIGDQLHPTAEMNESTYRLIGSAYKEIEAKEKYAVDAVNVSDIAILSAEAFSGIPNRDCLDDIGASRMLLEGKYLYDIIDKETDFDSYKLLILPDSIRLDAETKSRIDNYISKGGKLLLSGKSGLWTNKDEFAVNVGATYEGESEFKPSYMVPEYEAVNGKTSYVMYSARQNIIAKENILAFAEDSYFNRAPEHFSSHQHTPNNTESKKPAVVVTESIAYIAWNIFSEYAEKGSYHLKELVLECVRRLLPKPSVKVNLPDRGVVSLAKQDDKLITHLLFAHTTVRGRGIEVIEDIVPLYNTKISVKSDKIPIRVYKAEYIDDGLKLEDLNFEYEDGYVNTVIDKFALHAMIIMEL